MKIKATFQKIVDEKSGTSARGDWKKAEVLVKYADGTQIKDLYGTAWSNEDIAKFKALKHGNEIELSYSASSREYNGRWYTDVRFFGVNVPQTGTVFASNVPTYTHDNSLPNEGSETDELPF